MGSLEAMSLDDNVKTTLIAINKTTEYNNISKKRKRRRKKKNSKKQKDLHYECENNKLSDNGSVIKNNHIETIVIEDDDTVIELSDDDSVVELSNNEIRVNDGESSASFEKAQCQLNSFPIVPSKSIISRKCKSKTTENEKYFPEVRRLPSFVDCPKRTLSCEDPKATRKLRPIILDGSNIAFGHGDSRRHFSSRGIQICANFFLNKGHTVKAFVPQFRRRHKATLDTHILDKLEEDKILVYTPSRYINGLRVVSYDDRMMVEYAAQCGGVIVTRDNLRDLASENEVFKEVIAKRLLMFTWVDEEVILFPQDPLGRHGPTLNEFLSFPPEETDKPEGETSNDKPENPV